MAHHYLRSTCADRAGSRRSKIIPAFCLTLLLAACPWNATLHAAPFDFSGPVTTISATPALNSVTLDALDPNAGGLVSANIASGPTADISVSGGVAAWSSGSRVYYYVYDPFRKTWNGTNINAGGGTTFDLRNTNGVVAWTIGSTARYAAYDWGQSAWKTDSASLSGTANLFDVVDGIVSGTTGAGVFFAAYDPRAGVWKKSSVNSGPPGEWINTNGVIAWSVGTTVHGAAYDPPSGSWKINSVPAGGTPFDLRNGNGVIAWTRNPVVTYMVFDGTRSSWISGSDTVGFTADLAVVNSTVSWSTTTQSFRRGYNGITGAWAANFAVPRAAFHASTNSGNAPFTVTFTDLSVGGRVWSWNFGDNLGQSTRRSLIYRYTTFGEFLATETVSGDGGVSLTNLVIRTDAFAPTGTVTINNGEAFTTNLNVTLQLSASDNSGTVAGMRFSNDNATWSNWEPFAATKAWMLSPNGGVKTVFAQFRDAASNISPSASDTIEVDVTPPPVISFVSTNVLENAGNVVVLAVLDHAINRNVSANYVTSDGTAGEGEDYTGQSGTLFFPANTTSASITIPILPDAAVELNETILLNLSNPTNAILGTPGTVTIVDDDLASVSFASVNFNAAEDAGQATIAVRLNAPSGQAVTVRAVATAGTATEGTDFISTNLLLNFLPGQTNRTFNVAILDDLADELTETVSLSLTNLTNGVLGVPAQSTISILDNDQPFISFSSDHYSGFEADFSIAVHVRLSKPFSQQVSASYTITGGSATPGIDYTILGTVILPATTTNATITIFPINDSQRESDETIRLQLTDIAGAAPGRIETTVSILDEDGAPRFVATRREGGSFSATIRGKADQVFTIYSTTNLTLWNPLSTHTNTATGVFEFVVPAAEPPRFYKTFVSP